MDRIINTKTEQQSIYEIYRACRLCGAGAGYKMPIIQNVVVDLDTSGIELTQKIRDCVQIEVHPDDKMPPLICELCVDKVNDFFEFVELCQRTNKRTRMRLGLPPQTFTRTVNSDASSNSGDCILGVTEPVYQNYDSDEPLAPVTRRNKQSEGKHRVVKKENSKQYQKETKQKRPPTPPRATRLSKAPSDDSVALSKLKHQAKKSNKTSSPPQPKSILKKEKDKREDSPLPTRSKRPREPPKPEVPQKKVKLSAPASSTRSLSTPKPGPRSRRAPSPPRCPSPSPAPAPRPPPPAHRCRICGRVNATSQALASHHRSHTVQYTNPKLACNACEMWFSSIEEAQAHHRRHRVRRKPYRCRRCGVNWDTLQLYTDHIPAARGECGAGAGAGAGARSPLRAHDAPRTGGECIKCRRTFSLKKLKKHEAACKHRRKDDVVVDPRVLARLRPVQVRVSRCDALLTLQREHYDVAHVAQNYGLDRNCVYPYISSYGVQSELPRDSMVNIKAEIDDYEDQDFVHWDSDSDSDTGTEEAIRTVDSLSTLTLKKIFSKKCLGKVPRKRRKLKLEKNAFDSLLNASEFETTMSRDINNIINNLGVDDDSWDKNTNVKNDDNGNGSDEESLLTNYVLFDDPIVPSNDNKFNAVDNSDDSQSILDTSANSGNNEKVTDDNSIISTHDNDKMLEKESAESDKETRGKSKEYDEEAINKVEESNKEARGEVEESDKEAKEVEESDKEAKGEVEESEMDNVQEISRVSNENYIESRKTDDKNVNSNDTRKTIDNEDYTDENKTFVNPNNEVRLETKEVLSGEMSAGVTFDGDNIKESTNNDRANLIDEDKRMDCSDDISENVSSEITSNDVNNDTDTIDNIEIASNNHSDNTNNETEFTKHDTHETNNCNDKVHALSLEKISNGEIEERANKLSFGDMNDIETEIDDKNLMDALNEHIGENDKICVEVNGDVANHTEEFVQKADFPNEQNGAKLKNATNINHTNDFNDHENAINDLIAENNDTVTKNNDVLFNCGVSEPNDIFSASENRFHNDADKISLEDLLPPKCDSKSMELDSISDDDFDFDAC